MGLFVKQTEERSELQQKIAADIAQRQRAAAEGKPVDGIKDSRLVEGTAHLSWVGFVIAAVLIIAIIGIVIFVSVR